MKLTVKKSSLIQFIFWACYFTPLCFLNISQLLFNACDLVHAGIFLLTVLKLRGVRLNRFHTLLMVFLVWGALCMLLTTPGGILGYISGTLFPVLESMVIIYAATKEKGIEGLRPLYGVSCMYLVLNFTSMLLFRNGMFFSSIGSSVARAQWVFGSKNNVPSYTIIFICIVMIFSLAKKRNYFAWMLVFLGAFAIVFSGETRVEFMGGSSTGIVAAFICIMCYALVIFTKKISSVLNMKTALIGTGAINLLLLTGSSVPFIKNIVTNVFNKTMTFSGRSKIWATNISHIAESPLIGFGAERFQASVYIDGAWTTTGYRYNLILDLILSYGIVSVVILAFVFLSIPKSSDKEPQMMIIGLIGMFILGTMNQVELSFVMLFPTIMAMTHGTQVNRADKLSGEERIDYREPYELPYNIRY